MGAWQAALSGIIGGGTLLVGASAAWLWSIPSRVVAAIMAAGAGVLISTLAFELVEEAAADGGLVPAVVGFLAGAIIYIVADQLVSRPRKTVTPAAASATSAMSAGSANIVARRTAAGVAGGSGFVIAIGALIDGIPEAIVMGLSVVDGAGISIPIVAAVAIGNIPEGLASTVQLKRSGTPLRTIAALWGSIFVVTVVAALAGYLAFQAAPPALTAIVTTIAAGALLAMVCNTMIPEAFEEQRALTGLWATLGFLAAFVLHEVSG